MQTEIRSTSLKTGISRYDSNTQNIHYSCKTHIIPFNIGAKRLLVNRANIRKHYTEILIAVRNGMKKD